MTRKPLARIISTLFVSHAKPEYCMEELPGTFLRQYLYQLAVNGHRLFTHRIIYRGDIK